MPVIINISGYADVGKAAVGRLVAAGFQGRLITNHDVIIDAVRKWAA